LLIVNYLNGESLGLGESRSLAEVDSFFADVNDDTFTTSLDVLLIFMWQVLSSSHTVTGIRRLCDT